jgi:hypothetical protein
VTQVPSAAAEQPPLAVFRGSIECWNQLSPNDSGGVPAARLAIWPDRLELTAAGMLRVVFRPRALPRDRVVQVRPFISAHPAHELIQTVHPRGRGLNYVHILARQPAGEPAQRVRIHYLMGLRGGAATALLAALAGAGYPVSRERLVVTKFMIGPALHALDQAG